MSSTYTVTSQQITTLALGKLGVLRLEILLILHY